MKYILYGLLVYFLFRLVYNFIIPVYKTTRQVKKQFREMNERMNDQQQTSGQTTPSQPHTDPKTRVGEYIDFEEVK
jgi:hypothetical protein